MNISDQIRASIFSIVSPGLQAMAREQQEYEGAILDMMYIFGLTKEQAISRFKAFCGVSLGDWRDCRAAVLRGDTLALAYMRGEYEQ